MTSQAFSQAITRALDSSVMYSHGSLVKPSASTIPKSETRASNPPMLQQWVIQAADFKTSVVQQFREINVGEARLLVAGTGIGKTTKMPPLLVSVSGKAGLVLLPSQILVASSVKYVKSIAAELCGREILVEPLRSHWIAKPHKGPAVFYATAEDFLTRFQIDKTIVKRLKLDFIYLDEAHANTPAYYVMRMLVGLDFFTDTRVFYGTATAKDTSMILTNDMGERRLMARPVSDFPLDNPESTPSTSVVFARNINSRVLFFVATDQQVSAWESYFSGRDVYCLTYHTFHGSKRLEEIQSELVGRKRPVVIVSCSKLETGVTIDIDVVADGGYTQVLEIDFEVPELSLKVRTVTSEERVQRAGRAQRHLTGSSFYSDVKLSSVGSDLDVSSAMYVWMWSRMFNISVKSKEIAQFSELFGDYSDEAIALLLSSRVHPLLVRPYMNTEGELYNGWHLMRHVFRTNEPVKISQSDNETEVAMWLELNTGPQDWLDQPTDFRAKVGFPDEWLAIPVAAWIAFSTGTTNFGVFPDNNSVASALVQEKPKKKVAQFARAPSVRTVAETVNTRYSVMTAKRTESPQGEKFDFPPMPAVPEYFSGNSGQVVKSEKKNPLMRALSDDTEEVPRGSSVDEWVGDVSRAVVPSRSTRRRSYKSSNSSGSYDRIDMDLKKVDPRKYKHFKLFPMDESLMSRYMSRESALSEDYNRYFDLLRLKRNFASLRDEALSRVEAQQEYFISVIRVHNNQLMLKLQDAAAGRPEPSLFKRFFSVDPTQIDDRVEKSSNLLFAMHLEGYFVGVDKRTRHSSSSGSEVVRVPVAVKRLSLTSEYYMRVSRESVMSFVNFVRASAGAVWNGGKVVGTCWKFQTALLLPAHVYEKVDKFGFYPTAVDYDLDFVVCKGPLVCGVFPRVRDPVVGEEVLLLAMEPEEAVFSSYGPSVVSRMSSDVWCLNVVLAHGFSGAGVMAVLDGSIVGIYIGRYEKTGDGVEYSHFLPASKFASYVAHTMSH